MNWGRTLEIVRKEFRQVVRDPRLRLILVLPPLIQLIVFGFAVNLDVDNTELLWLDSDQTPASHDLAQAFTSSRHFTIIGTAAGQEEINQALDRGRAMAAVQILPGFAQDLNSGRTASVQILIDGSNSNTASIISRYMSQVLADFNAAYTRRQFQQKAAARGFFAGAEFPGVDPEIRVWFNENLLSRNYFVPGVFVNILALVTVMLTGMSIVREKEIGTMEQLMVTPIRPIELMLGKTLPFAVFGMGQLVVMIGLSLLIFHVPFRGSFLFLLVCAIVFFLSTLGIGLLISTISQTQQQAMMTFFFLFMPMFLLSGFAFPIRSMPLIFQYLTWINPLRYFMEIVRGIFLRGVGLEILWPQLVILTVFGVVILWISALRFRKSLD